MKYYHGTIVADFLKAYNPDTKTLDKSKMQHYLGDDRFYFFTPCPKFFDMLIFFTGKNGAARFSIRKSEWGVLRLEDGMSEPERIYSPPLIIYGTIPEEYQIYSGNVGYHIKENIVPVEKIFLGNNPIKQQSFLSTFKPIIFKEVSLENLLALEKTK